MDFIDLSTPEFSFPMLDAIKVTTFVNLEFKTTGPLRNIKGLVGTGYMEGKMLLSKTALHHGFSNQTDKRNTALHEFIHLIDKADGIVDGIPQVLLAEPNQIPWLEYIYKQIGLINHT